VTTVHDDGTRDRGPGWLDLKTDNQEIAQANYDHWLATGEEPSQLDRETFGAAVERLASEQDAALERARQAARAGLPPEPVDAVDDDRRMRLRTYAVPLIGMNEVGRLLPSHVSSVLKAMATARKSAAYIRKMRSDLSQTFVALIDTNAMTINVALGVPIPSKANVDTRLRMNLTDEQYLALQAARGFDEPIDVMILMVREVAGYRTSDLHAAAWEHCDLIAFLWVRVRRPKTDGEIGQHTRARKVRSYERVKHDISEHEHVREVLERYWRSLGCPERGPMFPLLRDGVAGMAKSRHGGTYRRQGSEAGGFKANGTSYADEFRAIVWAAKIYCPRVDEGFDDFDPAAPDKTRCALQTDTPTTRKLDFMSLRRDFVTAIHAAGVPTATALDAAGHTQINTQMKHYRKERSVAVPAAALPGRGRKRGAAPEPLPPDASTLPGGSAGAAGVKGGADAPPSAPGAAAALPPAALPPAPAPAAEPDRLAALERMMAELLALQLRQGGAPQAAPETGAGGAPAPAARAHGAAPGAPGLAKVVNLQVPPIGIEPMTSALGMQRSASVQTQTPANGDVESALAPPLHAHPPQPLGREIVSLDDARRRRSTRVK
jgi:hypothetical protein